MRFLFISDTPNPRMIGGGEFAIYKYAEALALCGHDVDVHGQFRRAFFSDLKSLPTLRVHVRGGIESPIRGAGKINRLWDLFHTRFILLPRLRRGPRPDVIIGYQRRSSIKAAALGKALNVPVAHIAFEPPTSMARALRKNENEDIPSDFGTEWEGVKLAYQSSRWLLPLTADAGRAVEAWCGKRVDAPVYAGMDAPANVLDIPASDSHILYIGRLDYTKNVHDLIDAVALMHNPPPLVIAGAGYDRDELEDRARKAGVKCTFTGVVSDAEKWRLIRSCYFLVFPTSLEGFGMPPGEALAAEKPAICSDIPVLREVYADAVEYFPVHHVQALSDVMQKMLVQHDDRKARGAAGRAYISRHYSWDRCADRILHVLGA